MNTCNLPTVWSILSAFLCWSIATKPRLMSATNERDRRKKWGHSWERETSFPPPTLSYTLDNSLCYSKSWRFNFKWLNRYFLVQKLSIQHDCRVVTVSSAALPRLQCTLESIAVVLVQFSTSMMRFRFTLFHNLVFRRTYAQSHKRPLRCKEGDGKCTSNSEFSGYCGNAE